MTLAEDKEQAIHYSQYLKALSGRDGRGGGEHSLVRCGEPGHGRTNEMERWTNNIGKHSSCCMKYGTLL